LDKVSDELLLECLPMLAVELNSVVHPCQLRCHLTLTPCATDHQSVGKESGRGTEGNEKRGNKLADRKKLLPHWQTTKEFVMYSCNICGFTKEKV
jgi:hypothetical protein